MRRLLAFLVFCLGFAPDVFAAEAKLIGWAKSADVGANVSYSSSQNVVGQTDGSTQLYGLNIKGSLDRGRERDEWRNSLSILENTSKTPSIPRFVKSGDELKLNTSYLYNYEGYPTVGPYISGELSAPLFKGEDVRATDTVYKQTNNDKTVQTFNGTSARLTDAFKPLNTKESAGVYWKPVQEDNIKVEGRLGIGAMEIRASGQYTLDGTGPAGEVLLKELTDINQVGLEASLSLKGKVDDKQIYEAGLSAMTPFSNNKPAGDDRSAWSLTNVEGFAKYSSKITSWLAISYDYKLKYQPQLVERAQQIHLVVLNMNYNLF